MKGWGRVRACWVLGMCGVMWSMQRCGVEEGIIFGVQEIKVR